MEGLGSYTIRGLEEPKVFHCILVTSGEMLKATLGSFTTFNIAVEQEFLCRAS